MTHACNLPISELGLIGWSWPAPTFLEKNYFREIFREGESAKEIEGRWFEPIQGFSKGNELFERRIFQNGRDNSLNRGANMEEYGFNGGIHYPALYPICVPFIIYPHDLVIRSRHYARPPLLCCGLSKRREGTSIGFPDGKLESLDGWKLIGKRGSREYSPKRAP